MLTFSTQNSSPFYLLFSCLLFSCSTIYFLLASTSVGGVCPHKTIPFMQNKANFQDAEMNVTPPPIGSYNTLTPQTRKKNKANSNPIAKKTATPAIKKRDTKHEIRDTNLIMQNKANFRRAKMTITLAITSTYEHKPPPEAPKNKANSPKRQNQRNPSLHKGLRKKTPSSRFGHCQAGRSYS